MRLREGEFPKENTTFLLEMNFNVPFTNFKPISTTSAKHWRAPA